ncbi:sugar transporter ERD6-like 5 isoform X1 [Rhododendron vialii]|uniref:sugar transporter ERD6-like 5 isoform X1 n=1 Tax=Rhododendron vialii TaxID=182163 RepID=UPI00265FC4A7|nr:sugar transporter ERD6-like 5 isoform X1 [Rhododendron vialii]
MEDGQVNRRLLLEEKIEDPDGGSRGEAAEGGISSSSVTAVVVFSTSVAVVGSFSYGFAAGFSSQAESGIRSDLGLSTAAYSLFGSMLTIGGMVGATVSGKVADLIGRRFTMLLSGAWFILGWLAILFAQGAWMLDIGRAVLGFGIALQTFVAPAYIGEISPKNTRGGFTAANQLLNCCGLSVVYFVGNLVTWRTLAIIGIIPCMVQVVGVFFIPESPRWLVKIGKEKDLDATLRRLRGKDADVSQEAADIRDYIEIVQQLPKAKFLDMFQRKYAHSLTIGFGLLLLAIFGGTVGISYYASSIYEAAGCSVSVGTTTMAIVQIPFSVLGLLLMDKTGRRPLWMISAAGTCLANFLIGLGFLLQNLNLNKDLTAILVFSGIQLYVATFSAGMASTPWVVVSEMLPLDIKGPAGSLITFCNWASAWVVSYGYIFILDWSPAGTFFILAGICASTVVFVAKLVPETKGRTLEEIQASLTLFT